MFKKNWTYIIEGENNLVTQKPPEFANNYSVGQIIEHAKHR